MRNKRIETKRKESTQQREQLIAKLLEKDITQEEIRDLMEQYCSLLEVEPGNKKGFAIQINQEIKNQRQREILSTRFATYSTYMKPFDREKYFRANPKIILDNGKVVSVTEADVDIAIQYIEQTGQQVCHGAVILAIKRLKKGELSEQTISGQDIGQATFDAPTSECDEAEAHMEGLISEQEMKIGGENK